MVVLVVAAASRIEVGGPRSVVVAALQSVLHFNLNSMNSRSLSLMFTCISGNIGKTKGQGCVNNLTSIFWISLCSEQLK